MESSKPSGAQQPQLPAAGAQRRRQHLSWPRSMRRCHARQWLAAELQPAHEPRRRQSAAVRASAVKRGRLRGVAAATTGALSTNRDILYFLMLSCSRKRRSGRLSAPVAGTPNNGRTAEVYQALQHAALFAGRGAPAAAGEQLPQGTIRHRCTGHHPGLFAAISTRSEHLRMRVVGAGVRPSQQTASEPAPQMCVPTVVDLARCSARIGRRAGGGLGSGLPKPQICR